MKELVSEIARTFLKRDSRKTRLTLPAIRTNYDIMVMKTDMGAGISKTFNGSLIHDYSGMIGNEERRDNLIDRIRKNVTI